jgi:hypothetical protein
VDTSGPLHRIVKEARPPAPPSADEVTRRRLPMRPVTHAPPPAPSFHQRVVAVSTPRRQVTLGRPPELSTVTGEQLRRARVLEKIPQRRLAAHCACSRSAVAEAERGRRPTLPTVAEWVQATLRAHGEWPEETEEVAL